MILITDILHEVIPEVVWRDDQAAEVDEGGHVPVNTRVTWIEAMLPTSWITALW